MSKKRSPRIYCLYLLAPVFLASIVAPLSALEPNDPLLGTWVNPEYAGSSAVHAKLVTFPDSRELGYGSVTSEEPECEHMYAVDETWTDAEGNRWYKTHGSWSQPLSTAKGKHYSLNRISAGGTVREWVWSGIDYPEELSPIGGSYSIYRRQE